MQFQSAVARLPVQDLDFLQQRWSLVGETAAGATMVLRVADSGNSDPMPVKTRKKLIEVALPLEAINAASVREGFIYRGNPSALHKWWAQRPLAAARAVIFAQMVDDPSTYVDTLLGVPDTRRAAERALKKRLELWVKRKAEHAAGKVDVPEPGPQPTL
jgi:hypothetical protein